LTTSSGRCATTAVDFDSGTGRGTAFRAFSAGSGHRPPETCYATVRERREKGRVVEVARTLVFGTLYLLGGMLRRSTASTTIDTSFVERNNGTDRHRNSRKRRETYGFSRDLAMHRAASYFIGYGDDFRWPVRTPRFREAGGPWQPRTPAMAAGLSDHVWGTKEWITYPAKPR
jgi:hypothetical protein